jgi:two-component system, LytTR family, sensor kinase
MLQNRFRFIFMSFLGILLTLMLKHFFYSFPNQHLLVSDFVVTITITCIVWEGNLRLDAWLNKRYSWIKLFWKRMLIQVFLSKMYSTIIIFSMMKLYDLAMELWMNRPCQLHKTGVDYALLIGIITNFIILFIEISSQFFKNWKSSLVQIEQYKTQTAQAQLTNLKEQINPHFLFNNLSVLSSLVHKNQDKAVDFIHQLAKVYRYLLESKNYELVPLKDELTFIESYNYLLSIRFDANLAFQLEVKEDVMQHLLPPMCLQMLIENAIKHNEVSATFPLCIYIKTIALRLIVSNNKQALRQTESSPKMGLKNIKARYAFYTDEQINIDESSKTFSVSIPLIPIT